MNKSNSSFSPSELITKVEAARLLNVSSSFVGKLLARKLLPRVRLAYRTVRLPRAAVEAFVASHTSVAKESRI